MIEKQDCPNIAAHTPGEPTGYGAFFEWAKKMGRTHRSTRCPVCELYVIWVPKKKRTAA